MALLLLLILVSPSLSMAFMNGAGGCPEGRAAVGTLHLQESPNRSITTGALSDGALELKIFGRRVREGEALTLPVGIDLNWTLSASGRPFRGFLLRLNGGRNNIDTRSALIAPDDNNVVRARTICNSYHGVGGVNHNNNQIKTKVSGILRVDASSEHMALDVTVVVENRFNASTYYYSGYALNLFPALTTAVDTCDSTHPCGECTGDCNTDLQCVSGLECYQRTGEDTSAVPGCFGAGVAGFDYCYEPVPDTLRLRKNKCSEEYPCARCVGDCHTDEDCVGDLKCFHRRSGDDTSISGCLGRGISGLDYCYDERFGKGQADFEDGFCLIDADCDPPTSIGTATDPDVVLISTCRDNQCQYVHNCGPSMCLDSEYCCNLSCGTCVSKENDIGCSDVICIFRNDGNAEEDKGELDDSIYLSSGCRGDGDCNAVAGCKPGDHCPQVTCFNNRCTFNDPCGPTFCGFGEFCCSSECGKCISYRQQETCVPELACDGDRTDDDVLAEFESCQDDNDCSDVISICWDEPCPEIVCRTGECRTILPCGHNECQVDEYCCNESCGTCLKKNETDSCDALAVCEGCGETVCAIDEYCCNDGCSLCSPIRGSCLPLLCSAGRNGDTLTNETLLANETNSTVEAFGKSGNHNLLRRKR